MTGDRIEPSEPEVSNDLHHAARNSLPACRKNVPKPMDKQLTEDEAKQESIHIGNSRSENNANLTGDILQSTLGANGQGSLSLKKIRKTTSVVGMVLAVYMVCFVCMLVIVVIFLINPVSLSIGKWITIIFQLLLCINSFSNIVIFMIRFEGFRKAVISLVKMERQ